MARRNVRFLRLASLAAAIAVVIVVGGVLLESVSRVAYWVALVRLLDAFELMYAFCLAACAIGVPTCLARVIHGFKVGIRRPGSARALLLLVSSAIAFAACEAACAIVRPRGEVGVETPHSAPPIHLPDLVRDGPLPSTFPDEEDGVIDLVVLGESSAAGVPYNLYNLSIGNILAWKLTEAMPDRSFRLAQLAQSGDTLEGQYKKLAHLGRKPEMVLLYCGHNEFSARISAEREVDHYEDAHEPTTWDSLVALARRTSPFCNLIHATREKYRVAIPPTLGERRALVDLPSFTPGEREALKRDFRERLDAVAEYCDRVGAQLVLISPPGNDADFEPNRSILPPKATRADRAAVAAAFDEARALEGSDPAEALRRYLALIDLQPGFAEAHHRAARLLQRSGDDEAAYRHFAAARDADGWPMRCLSDFQDAYRDVAARHDAVLIDGPSYFHAIGHRGRLDDRLFHDGQHPSLRGQSALALAVLQSLHARRAFGWPEGSPEPYVDPEACATRFGLKSGAWVKLCHWGIMFYDLTSPARFDSNERRSKQDAFGKAADRIEAGAAPESVGLLNIGVAPAAPPFGRQGVLQSMSQHVTTPGGSSEIRGQ